MPAGCWRRNLKPSGRPRNTRQSIRSGRLISLRNLRARFSVSRGPVIIESAIRMAGRFGTDESGRFVNSVLDKLAKGLKDGSIPRPVQSRSSDVPGEDE